MRRVLVSCAVVALALLAQLTIVNRLALPGGAGPDLVLLAVVALALTGGPLPGMLTGFLAGLALDVAPPASHTIGQYALVFCLVGYGCGRLAVLGDGSPALYVGISAAAVAVGAALHAVLGVMLSDPEVTWSAVRHVLPPSLIYDLILSPFVLYAVVRLNAWAARAGASPEGAPSGVSAAAGWSASAVGSAAGLTTGAVRQASTSGSPRLHLADHRGSDAWIGAARTGNGTGLAGPARLRPGGAREPKLRFSGLTGAGAGPAPGGRANGGAAGSRYSGSKSAPKMHFSTAGRHDGLAGRGSGSAPRSGAVPRFRKRSSLATIGTGGSLSRSTPRRGTFGRGRSFGRRQSFGASSAGARSMGSRSVGSRSVGSRSVGSRSMGSRSMGSRSMGSGSFGKRRSFGASSVGSRSVGGRWFGRRRSAPRLRMKRGALRARISRLLGRKTGGYR